MQKQDPNSSRPETISRKQFDSVLQALSAFAQKLQVRAVLLVTSSGQTIAQYPVSPDPFPSSLLSALAASSFAASKEIARLISEPGFDMVLFEGQKQNVFVSSVTRHHFLIVVFEKNTALGMVRLFTKKTREELFLVLAKPGEESWEADEKFNILLDQKLDQIFGE